MTVINDKPSTTASPPVAAVPGVAAPAGWLVRARRHAPLVVFAAAALLPLVHRDQYMLDVLFQVFLYITLGLGLDIVVGRAGLLDLGYSAFFAIGAYTTAVLMTTYQVPFWFTLPIAVVFSCIAGAIIGAPTLRLRSDYLAIVTLGFGEITRLAATNLEFTGSATGIFGIPRPTLGPLVLNDPVYFYYMMLALAFVTALAGQRLGASRIGRAWAYIRDDEDAAQAMGINTIWIKLLAYMTGAVWAGLVGAIFVVKQTAVAPETFTFMQSITILMVVVMGGPTSLPGVVLGAAIIVALPELLRELAQLRLLGFGIGLMLLMLFRPQGLIPARREHIGD